MQSGDWNDGFSSIAHCRTEACRTQVQQQGESVMNSAMATYILPRFADALELCNATRNATGEASPLLRGVIDPRDVRLFAKEQETVVLAAAWNGAWFNRAWLPTTGFVGTNNRHDPIGIQLEPQGWPLARGFLNASVRGKVVQAIMSLRTPAGLRQARSGHVWGALHHPTVIGVAHSNATLAWDLWLDATLHTQATLFPDYWPGVWSSADYMRACHPHA